MRVTFSQRVVSTEGGEDNGCKEESQESCQEGREESQEGREEEVVDRAGAQKAPAFSFPNPLPSGRGLGSGP
jgi:hypothetical protein